MAPTRIADVIVPSVFNPYVVQRTMELSALVQSGIVANNPELDALASAGGRTINMPYWNDLAGADEVLSDTTALTPQNITASQDIAVLLLRGKAWAANDLAGALAGSDPMGAIAQLVAAYWARRMQAALMSTLKGAFAAANMTGNIYNISGASGAASNFTAAEFINATQLLGDAKDQLTAVAMHSAVEAELAKEDLIEYERDSTGMIRVRRYLGNVVIVDDALAPASGVYTTYLFGPGAIGLGNGQPDYPTETDRDSLAGDDILINRQHFILHPRGIKFNSASVAGAAPTNAELETAANWTRVYENKAIRMVAFKHKIGQVDA